MPSSPWLLHPPCSRTPAPSKPRSSCSCSLGRELRGERGSDALRLPAPPKRWMERSLGRKREGKSAPPDRHPGCGDSGDTAPSPRPVPGVWVAVQDSPAAKNVPCRLPPRPLLSPAGLSPDNPGGKPVWRSRWSKARRLSRSATLSYTQPFSTATLGSSTLMGFTPALPNLSELPPLPAGTIPPHGPGASRTPAPARTHLPPPRGCLGSAEAPLPW